MYIQIAARGLDNPFLAKHVERHHWNVSSHDATWMNMGSEFARAQSMDPQVLPDSLADAVMDAASATADAIMRSNNKCQVGRSGQMTG